MLAAVLGGERVEDRAIEEDAKKGIIRARKPVQGNINAAAGSAAGEGGPPAGAGTAAGEGGPPAVGSGKFKGQRSKLSSKFEGQSKRGSGTGVPGPLFC